MGEIMVGACECPLMLLLNVVSYFRRVPEAVGKRPREALLQLTRIHPVLLESRNRVVPLPYSKLNASHELAL